MVDEVESLGHTNREVQMPRGVYLGVPKEVVRRVATVPWESIAQSWRITEGRIEEGHLMPELVHTGIGIPTKYALSQVIGLSVQFISRECARVGKWNHVGQGGGGFRPSTEARRRSATTSANRTGRRSAVRADQRCGVETTTSTN